MKRYILFAFIIANLTVVAQIDNNLKEDFTAEKVNLYLDKYGVKVAKLTDKIVLDGTLKNAGVFYTYSTLNSYIQLYELLNTETTPIEYFNKSMKILNSSVSTLISIFSYNALPVSFSPTAIFPSLQLLNTGIGLSNEAIKLTAEDLDKKFLFNQLIYYKKMIEFNVSVDPYGDEYINDGGYLLSPTGQSFAPLDRNKLTSDFVKNWVLSNYEIIKNKKELEREALINAQKLHDYLDWRCMEIEKYRTGLLTKVLVNTDNSVIVINTGNDTLYNFEFADNFIGIPLKRSTQHTILPNSQLQINLIDFDSRDINAMQFRLLGEDIKLNFQNQKLPYLSLMNVFLDSKNEYKGYAPARIITHLLVLTSGEHQNFTTVIDYGDNTKKDTVFLNNDINSFVDFDSNHKYAQPGSYTIKISTKNESGFENNIEKSFEVLNPIKMGLPFNKDEILTPDSQIRFSADSIKCIYPNTTINYNWDFNYNGKNFNVSKTGKNVSWNFNTSPTEFENKNQVEQTVGLTVSFLRDSVTISDSVFQSIKLSNPVVARFTSSNPENEMIIDVDSIPYKVYFDANKSFSYKKDSIYYTWKIDNSFVSNNKTMKYEFKNTGKHIVSLSVDDGNYFKIKKDSITLDFNIDYNPLSKINQIEYFFDRDPGAGKGISLPLNFENSVIKVSSTINCNNLSTGLHRIYFRIKDSSGNWSIPQSQIIIVQSFNPSATQVAVGEYFYDQDPGIGNGIKLTMQVGDSVSISTIENIQNISLGLHRLYFRAKDNLGNWSIPQSQIVIVQSVNCSNSLSKINYAEYFFDIDPGLGLATKFNITSSDDLLITETLNIEILSQGIHTLCIRVRDELGKWSFPISAQFEVDKGIATNTSSSIANNDNNYKIFGGKERITVITPNNDINRKYQLKVYTLSGNLILDKHVVGSQKITINKGFYVVDILDDLHENKTTQKILTY